MAIKVKSKPEAPELLNDYITVNGVTNTYTPKMQKEAVRDVLKVTSSRAGEMTIKQLEVALEAKQAAIALIKSKFVEGRHYIQPTEAMSPFMTQEGAAIIVSATNADITYKREDETFSESGNLYMCEYRLTLGWRDREAVSATGFASSKEADIRKQYEKCTKDGEWIRVPGKSVHDTIHNVQAKAKKRALVTAVRVAFGLTGEFGEEFDNPLANKTSQQSVYTSFYKLALRYAPEAPKKQKNKNGIKTFTEKERLDWQKEWLRAKILQPGLLKGGFPTFNWGTQDIKAIKNQMFKWVEDYASSLEKEKKHETGN